MLEPIPPPKWQELGSSLINIRRDMKRHRLQLLSLELQQKEEERQQNDEAFASADANGDGVLDKAEALTFARLLHQNSQLERSKKNELTAAAKREADEAAAEDEEPRASWHDEGAPTDA